MRTLLIIPAYNEAGGIVTTCRSIQEVRPDVDFVVINDGSTDKTSELCAREGFPCIDLLRNLGIGGAVQTGYIYAWQHGYDCAVQFDGDGQHDIHSLENILQPIRDDECDFCIGSRFIENTSEFKSTFARRIGIRYISALISLLGRKKIFDPTSGFRAANRKAIKILAKTYPLQYPEPESIMMLLKKNIRIQERQVNMLARQADQSSIRSWRTVYYMLTITLATIFISFVSIEEE